MTSPERQILPFEAIKWSMWSFLGLLEVGTMSIVHRYNKKMSSLGIIFWANIHSGVWKIRPKSVCSSVQCRELLSLTCSCVEVWSLECICPPWRKPVWSPQWGALVSGHPLQGPWTRKPGHVQQLSPDSPAGPQNQGGCMEANQCMLFTFGGSGVVSIPLSTYLGFLHKNKSELFISPLPNRLVQQLALLFSLFSLASSLKNTQNSMLHISYHP